MFFYLQINVFKSYDFCSILRVIDRLLIAALKRQKQSNGRQFNCENCVTNGEQSFSIFALQ